MMRALRENTKIILWIVVIAFVVTIFAVWGLDLRTGRGGADPDILGRVNGVPITRSQYQFIYEQFAQQMRASSQDQALTYAQQQFVESQAWDNLVYGILTDQEIKRLGITVSDDEIVFYLRNTPPVEIRQYFLDENNVFDNEAYQAALSNPEIDWTNLEALARERIPRIKLNEYLSAQVHVSEDEVRRAFQAESLTLDLEYVQVPIATADIGDYVPSDEEVQTYYDQHHDDFESAEKASVELVTIDLDPSPADIADARYTAGRVHDQLVDGEDFGVLAKTYSEAPTASVEGNTGFLKKGARDAAVFDALAKLEPGQFSEPIATDKGFYVVKLLEKKKGDDGEDQFNMQEILVTAAVSRATSDSLSTVANDLRSEASSSSLAEAAAARGFDLLKPPPFSAGSPVSGLGFAPVVSDFAFSAKPNTLSQVLRDDNRIYLVHLIDRTPATVRPLDEVKDMIRARLTADRRRDVAQVKARGFYNGARQKGADFEKTAADYGLELNHPEPFTGLDNLGDFGPLSPVADAALIVSAGDIAPPVEASGSWVVLKLLSKSEFDIDDYKARFTSIRKTLRDAKVQDYVTYWYEKIKEDSVIEDYRNQFSST